MGEHVLHTVYWDDLCSNTYLYGSDIRFNNDKTVFFESLMMPSGMTIKKWMSSAGYQRTRVEPSLPMLISGREYILRAFYDEEPEGSLFIRLDFFDQQKKKTGIIIVDGKQSSFQCPDHTYSYTAELVQGGADRVRFDRLEIFPASDRLFYQITNPKITTPVNTTPGTTNPIGGEAVLTFLIPSETGRSVVVFDEDIPEGLTDYMVLSPFGPELTAKRLDSIMKAISPPDAYKGLCVYLQDEDRLKSMLEQGWQTLNRQFRLWKTAEDE